MSASEFAGILQNVLNGGEVRDPKAPHPKVMIWGTLEARVQGADLVILAGLNDGIWPETPSPDPWLNRKMRLDAGLFLPERRVGLSAHDFQQAIAAPKVWLTRSIRDAETQTVPSRWLNRLGNLMRGLNAKSKQAWEAMQDRGQHWLDQTRALETPVVDIPKAARPAPSPPLAHRPGQLSVTQIETLIRDPYEIYARNVLGLRKLRPLSLGTDAALRGQLVHGLLERFIDETRDRLPDDAYPRLMQLAREIFAETVPSRAIQALWLARLDRAATWFLETEKDRRRMAAPLLQETTGNVTLALADFKLTGRADRIDRTPEGQLVIYDYKTGMLSSDKQIKQFDHQLPLLAYIAQRGGYPDLAAAEVAATGYISLGANPEERLTAHAKGDIEAVWDKFTALIASYANDEKGYTARRAIEQTRFDNDYDQLSRFGEWDQTDRPVSRKVGR